MRPDLFDKSNFGETHEFHQRLDYPLILFFPSLKIK
jgi:hypothetical protein